jgi:hypothetical protein
MENPKSKDVNQAIAEHRRKERAQKENKAINAGDVVLDLDKEPEMDVNQAIAKHRRKKRAQKKEKELIAAFLNELSKTRSGRRLAKRDKRIMAERREQGNQGLISAWDDAIAEGKSSPPLQEGDIAAAQKNLRIHWNKKSNWGVEKENIKSAASLAEKVRSQRRNAKRRSLAERDAKRRRNHAGDAKDKTLNIYVDIYLRIANKLMFDSMVQSNPKQ